MRKTFKMAAALGLVAMTAVPAMAASVDMAGFYRAKGYVTNFFNSGAGDVLSGAAVAQKDAPTASYVDQRWRGKITVGDETVKAVTHLEINGIWGQKSATANADLSGDGTVIAVKDLYLWFKAADPIDVTVGLQSMSDPYQGFFMGAADVAGVTTNIKINEQVGLKLGYLVPFVNNIVKDESNTVYLAEAAIAPTKDIKVGANLYFWRDGGANVGGPSTAAGLAKLYMPGVNFAVNAGPAQISGFVLGQFGDRKFDNAAVAKTKFSGYAADVRGDVAAGPAKVFVEALYVTGDKSSSADKFEGFRVLDDIHHGAGNSTFNRNDMVILTPAADSIGTAGALTYDLSNDGKGALHVAAGAKMDVAPKLNVKVGAGYLASAKERVAGGKKDMGTELNLMVNYNLAKGLDVSGTAAYAFLGKYFTDLTTGQTPDADDPYALIAKVNYAY
jgi:hypothetical protein